jgi:iron complex outermembrane receptor protein
MKKCFSNTIAFVIFFNVGLSQICAQDGILKGKIKSKEEVLQAATVYAGEKTVLTDEAGEFTISLLPGTYTLTVSYTGYQTIQKPVKINAGDTIEIDFSLERDEQLSEVVVLGSRSAIRRSNMNSAVPVDIVKGGKLSVALNDLTQQLAIILPSFNSPPQTVGSSVVLTPASLRGLSPNETLVLLNGRRRHTASIIQLQYNPGYGTGGTDLNCIPAAAIEEVQVLRDGAAGQYGSDAIAGVLDMQLKKSTGKTEANVHLGQTYKGDGETISFDINRGFAINKKGFINFTIESRFSNPTQRNGMYDSTVYYNIPPNSSQTVIDYLRTQDNEKIAQTGFDRLNHRRIGAPQIFNSSLLINGGYPVNKKTNLFWMGIFNYRHSIDRGSNVYRYPKNDNTVILSLYPDGFTPKVFVTTFNGSIMAGMEGKTANDWRWDISSVLGGTSNNPYLTNTNNASQYALGKNAQTNFHPGSTIFIQNTNNINFSKNFAEYFKDLKSFSVSFGGEFRVENYRINEGEKASWEDYDSSHRKQWGSQGGAGFRDSNVVNKNRYVSAVYVELEMEPHEKFLWNISGRYEHYSDYGSNLAGKLAVRYKFSNHFLLRGSFSNGFRAPDIQQRYFSNAGPITSRINLVPTTLITETFRNDGHTAEAFGIAPLKAETSLNISSGITSKVSKNIDVTLDAYWIQISNRITLTGIIPGDSSIWIKSILNSLNKSDIAATRFFANAISTQTRGIDLVVTGNWPIGKSFLETSLSANYNKTHIFKTVQPAKNLPDDAKHQNLIVNREERGRLEQGQPLCKIILAITYKIRKWNFNFRTVYFGKAAHLSATTDPTTGLYPDEFFSPKTLAGFAIGFSPARWLTIQAGARNIFNTYPDKIKNRTNTQGGLVIYDFNGSQIGYNGGYYFVNMSFSF